MKQIAKYFLNYSFNFAIFNNRLIIGLVFSLKRRLITYCPNI